MKVQLRWGVTSAENQAKRGFTLTTVEHMILLGKVDCTHGGVSVDSKGPRKEVGPQALVLLMYSFPSAACGQCLPVSIWDVMLRKTRRWNFCLRFLPAIYPLALKLWANHLTSLCLC